MEGHASTSSVSGRNTEHNHDMASFVDSLIGQACLRASPNIVVQPPLPENASPKSSVNTSSSSSARSDSSSSNMNTRSRRRKSARKRIVVESSEDEITPVEQHAQPPSNRDEEEQASDDAGVPLELPEFNPEDYDEVEVLTRLEQIIVPDYTLRKAGQDHVANMYSLLDKFGYRTSTGVLTVTVRQLKNPDLQSTSVNAITSSPGDHQFPRLNDNVKCDIVDGLHRHSAMNRLKEAMNAPEWLGQPFRVVLIRRKDGKDMFNTEILEHAKARNIRSGSAKKDKDFLDFIYSVMSYIKSLAAGHKRKIEDLRVTDIAKAMKRAEYLSDASLSTYRRYSRIGKCFCTFEDAVDNLLESMRGKSDSDRSRIGPTHIDTEFFTDHSTSNAEAWFVLEGLSKRLLDPIEPSKNKKMGPFPSAQFYDLCRSMLQSLRKCFEEFKDDHEDFDAFLQRRFSLSNANKPIIRHHAIRILQNIYSTKVSMQLCTKAIQRMTEKINAEFSDVVEVPVVKKKKARKRKTRARSVSPLPHPKRKKTAGPVTRSSSHSQTDSITAAELLQNSPTAVNVKKAGPARNHQAEDNDQARVESDDEVVEVFGTDDDDSDGFDDQLPDLSDPSFTSTDVAPFSFHPWSKHFAGPPSVLLQVCPSEAREFRMSAFQSAHIPQNHRAYSFVGAEDITALHKCLWQKAAENGFSSCEVNREDSPTMSDPVFMLRASNYFTRKRAELDNRGYCILEGFGDHTSVDRKYWERDNSNGQFRSFGSVSEQFSTTLQKMFHALHSEMENETKAEMDHNSTQGNEPFVRTLFRPIVNLGLPRRDEENNDRMHSRYQSTNHCVTQFSESDGRRWIAVRRALLDVWIGLTACALNLTNTQDGPNSWLPVSGGRFLATGKGCPRQTAHNDFPHDQYDANDPRSFPGYFVIVSAESRFPLWVMPGSHWKQNHSEWRRNLIGLFSKLEKIVVPENSIIIGHGVLTHAGGGWEDRLQDGSPLRYHTYLTPEAFKLRNRIYYSLGGHSSYLSPGNPRSPQHELYEDILKPLSIQYAQEQMQKGSTVSRQSIENSIEIESSKGTAYDEDEEEQPAFQDDDDENGGNEPDPFDSDSFASDEPEDDMPEDDLPDDS